MTKSMREPKFLLTYLSIFTIIASSYHSILARGERRICDMIAKSPSRKSSAGGGDPARHFRDRKYHDMQRHHADRLIRRRRQEL